MTRENLSGLSRRAWTRMALWGAVGLSLLPGCRRRLLGGTTCYAPPPPKSDDLARQPILARWAEVGRVWRELSSHSRRPAKGQAEDLATKFQALKPEMERALDALPAWPELRVVFEERWAHIDRLRYSQMTCYAPLPPGTPQPQFDVEEQVSALEKLVEEGKLTKEAAAKAAAALGKQAQYDVELAGLQNAADPAERKALDKQYNAGTLKLSPGATLAGQRLAELTVDKLGMLAGEPTEEELPKPEPAEEAAKEAAP